MEKHLKTNYEALHALDDRAREYLLYMHATLKGADIASGNEPKEYYYNYCYSVDEGGDFI